MQVGSNVAIVGLDCMHTPRAIWLHDAYPAGFIKWATHACWPHFTLRECSAHAHAASCSTRAWWHAHMRMRIFMSIFMWGNTKKATQRYQNRIRTH